MATRTAPRNRMRPVHPGEVLREEYLVPLGKPTQFDPPAYAKSQKVEGLLSRYTYVAPEGRTTAEVFRNYQLEFQRLNLVTSSFVWGVGKTPSPAGGPSARSATPLASMLPPHGGGEVGAAAPPTARPNGPAGPTSPRRGEVGPERQRRDG